MLLDLTGHPNKQTNKICACTMCGTVVSLQLIMCLFREDIANSLSGHKMQVRKGTPLLKQVMEAAFSEVLSGFT